MLSKVNTRPSPTTHTFGEREKRNVISFTFGLKLGFANLVLALFGA